MINDLNDHLNERFRGINQKPAEILKCCNDVFVLIAAFLVVCYDCCEDGPVTPLLTTRGSENHHTGNLCVRVLACCNLPIKYFPIWLLFLSCHIRVHTVADIFLLAWLTGRFDGTHNRL